MTAHLSKPKHDLLTILLLLAVTSSCTAHRSQFTKEAAQKHMVKVIEDLGDTIGIRCLNSWASANVKHIIWDDSYVFGNKESEFVEVPIRQDRKASYLFFLDSASAASKAIVKEQLAGTFDRLVVSRDRQTGLIKEFVVSFVPSLKYLRDHSNDASLNHINKIDRDFSGFINYRTWDERPVYLYEIKDGIVSKICRMPVEEMKHPRLKANTSSKALLAVVYSQAAPDSTKR